MEDRTKNTTLVVANILIGLVFLFLVAVGVGIVGYAVLHEPANAVQHHTENAEFDAQERTALLVLISSTLDHRRQQGWHNTPTLSVYDRQLMHMFETLTGQPWNPQIKIGNAPVGSENPYGAAPAGFGSAKPDDKGP